MENKSYLRTILGGTDFKSLSLMEKIKCINVVLLWLCKRHVRKVWIRWTCAPSLRDYRRQGQGFFTW